MIVCFSMTELQPTIYVHSGNNINPKKPDVAPGDALLALMDFSGFD